nr:hypothetical protein [Acidobacteriota bacterium]
MLYRELLTTELDHQREDFRRFADSQAGELAVYLNKLKQLNNTPYAEVKKELADKDAGAIPSDELDNLKTFSVLFSESWANHEEARGWA